MSGTEGVRIPLYKRGDSILCGYAIVDADDAPRTMHYIWRPANSGRYARAWGVQAGGRIYLHQFIAGTTNVDHHNGNGLDNRRLNLRPCTRIQNMQNKRVPCTNTSGYKGVRRVQKTGRYKATITANKERVHLGYHQTPEQAARAYNDAAVRLHGTFARLNVIEEQRP